MTLLLDAECGREQQAPVRAWFPAAILHSVGKRAHLQDVDLCIVSKRQQSARCLCEHCRGVRGALEVELRAAAAEEIPDLAQLAIMAGSGLLDAIYQGAIPALPTNEIVERRLRRIGTTKSYENCWVAVHRGRVVGFLNAYPMDDEALDPADPLLRDDRRYLVEPSERLDARATFHLNTIAVLPNYRSHGVGTKLLSFAHSRAQAAGLSALSLIVFEQNTRAVALYERVGFSVVKRSRAAAHESVRYSGDLILMTCPV
ncbi:MAG TPA: GNAT family N-acetyltransferase [Candidatus Acidoferrum sp.]|nr:GNAT family N-acetyltransferase [Candidatus Acidoferrum sp.]